MALRDKVARYIPGVANRSPMPREQAMAIIPVHNPSIAWEKVEGGEVVVRIPRRSDRLGRLISKVFKVPDRKEVLLDEVGGSVWELCDGVHDIGYIIAETSKMYKLNRREAEVSVTAYIKTLAERKFIGLLQRGGKPRHGSRS